MRFPNTGARRAHHRPDGEIDYGNIDSFVWSRSWFEIQGEFEHVRVDADPPTVTERKADASGVIPEHWPRRATSSPVCFIAMPALDSQRWAELRTAYRATVDVPKMLSELEAVPNSEEFRDEPWFGIWSALAHQGIPGARDAALRFYEHRGALIDSDDRAAEAADELERDGGRSARDVEDSVAWRGLDTRDEE